MAATLRCQRCIPTLVEGMFEPKLDVPGPAPFAVMAMPEGPANQPSFRFTKWTPATGSGVATRVSRMLGSEML